MQGRLGIVVAGYCNGGERLSQKLSGDRGFCNYNEKEEKWILEDNQQSAQMSKFTLMYMVNILGREIRFDMQNFSK